jgi:hypothetical protein
MKADLRAVADQLRKQHSELQSRIRELDEKVRKLEKLLSLDLGTALLPLLLSLVCSLARPLHLVFFFFFGDRLRTSKRVLRAVGSTLHFQDGPVLFFLLFDTLLHSSVFPSLISEQVHV